MLPLRSLHHNKTVIFDLMLFQKSVVGHNFIEIFWMPLQCWKFNSAGNSTVRIMNPDSLYLIFLYVLFDGNMEAQLPGPYIVIAPLVTLELE